MFSVLYGNPAPWPGDCSKRVTTVRKMPVLTDTITTSIDQASSLPIRRGSRRDEPSPSFDLLLKEQEQRDAADRTVEQTKKRDATERAYDGNPDEQRADEEVNRAASEEDLNEPSPAHGRDRPETEAYSRPTQRARDNSEPTPEMADGADLAPAEEPGIATSTSNGVTGGGHAEGGVPLLKHATDAGDRMSQEGDVTSLDQSPSSEGLATGVLFAFGQPIPTRGVPNVGFLLSPAASASSGGPAASAGTGLPAGSALAPAASTSSSALASPPGGPVIASTAEPKITHGLHGASQPPGIVDGSSALAGGTTSDGGSPADERPMKQGKDQSALGDQASGVRTPVADATSATASAEKAATSVRPMVQQVAVHMARGAKNGLSHVHIALEPDSLGHLEIRLDFGRDGSLSAAIVADRPETLNMLRSEARALEDSLNNAGFRASQDSLSFDLSSSSDQGSAFHAQAQSGRASASYGENNEMGDDGAPKSPVWRPVLAGRLDIRA